MSQAAENAVFYAALLLAYLAVAVSADRAIMGPRYGRGNYWRKRGPVLLGFWLPTMAVVCAAIFLYSLRPHKPGWGWLSSAVGAAGWAGFLFLRQVVVRRSRRGRGDHPAPPSTRPQLWRDLSQAPRGRIIGLALVSLWALAGIIGVVFTFLAKR